MFKASSLVSAGPRVQDCLLESVLSLFSSLEWSAGVRSRNSSVSSPADNCALTLNLATPHWSTLYSVILLQSTDHSDTERPSVMLVQLQLLGAEFRAGLFQPLSVEAALINNFWCQLNQR